MNKRIEEKEVDYIDVPEKEISLTVEEIFNYGFKYSKKKNINISYGDIVRVLSPKTNSDLTEADIEDLIDASFEDKLDFVSYEEDYDTDWGLELEEEEIDCILEKEEEYFI